MKKNNKIYLPAFIAILSLLVSITSFASVKRLDNQKFFEIGLAKSQALDTGLYIPNATLGGFEYRKYPFQITLGFLSKDVAKQNSGKLQELNDFFYIGPQYKKTYRLFSDVSSELGLAILTGNLHYSVAKTNNSSFREGMFFAIQPNVKVLLKLSKSLKFIVDFHYIMTSAELEGEPVDVGPSIGAGLRYNFHFSF